MRFVARWEFIVGKEPPRPELAPRLTRNAQVRRQSGNGRSEFRILEHVGSVRKIGRNYVARCPSVQRAGTTDVETTWPS